MSSVKVASKFCADRFYNPSRKAQGGIVRGFSIPLPVLSNSNPCQFSLFHSTDSLCKRWLQPQNGESPLNKFHLFFETASEEVFHSPKAGNRRTTAPFLPWLSCCRWVLVYLF